MAQASHDQNHVPTALAVSNVDGSTPVTLYADPTTHRLLVSSAAGGGDVSGPGSSTDNAVARWNGTTGLDIQNSGVIIDDSNNVTGVAALTASGAIRSNTSLIVEETGAGTDTITLQAPASIAASYTLTLPTTDGDASQFLQTDGSGVLSWASGGSGDVTAASNLTDNAIVRGDGGAKGVQTSSVLISDTDDVTGMASLTLPNTGLHLLDTNASHDLIIAPGSDLSADRTLTVTTGDSDRTLTLSGNATISGTNTGDVTLAGTPDYITISGQVITRGAVDMATDVTGTLPVANGGTGVTSSTGTTAVVLSNSPTLVTPVLGVATATSVNKVAITAPATSATLTLADGSSLVTSGANSITLTSSGATNVTLPTTGTLATLAGSETLSNKTLTAPKFANGGFIADANGNEEIIFNTTASAVNEVAITNAATGTTGPLIAASGETNVDLRLAGKGTGAIHNTTGSYGDITADADGATITFNLATSNIHSVTLGGNRTLALSNEHVGQCFMLRLLQDGTGSRTVTWFTTIKWAGGAAPTLTTTANKADMIGFLVTSAGNYDGFVVGQNL